MWPGNENVTYGRAALSGPGLALGRSLRRGPTNNAQLLVMTSLTSF